MDGLVGGDVHEVRYGVLERHRDEVVAADDVVEDGFLGVLLHQRHMLVRGGVEHHLRPVGREHVIEPVAVLDGADDGPVAHLRPLAVELALQGVDAVLAVAEEDELGRLEAADLAHQLRADRAAGAGDHHTLALDVAEDGVGVELDRRSPEQVADVHVADAAHVDLARQHLVHVRDDLVAQARRGVVDQVHHSPHAHAVGRRHRDEDLVDLALAHDGTDVAQRAQHGHAGDAHALLVGGIVDEADGVHAGLGVAEQLADGLRAGLAGPDDQHAPATGRLDVGQVAPFVLEACPRPQAGHAAQGEQRVQDGRGVRQVERRCDGGHDQAGEQRVERHHRQQRPQVAEGHRAPRLGVGAERRVADQLEGDQQQRGPEDGRPHAFQGAVVERDQDGEGGRDQQHRQVAEHLRCEPEARTAESLGPGMPPQSRRHFDHIPTSGRSVWGFPGRR
ncbi:MAG: hypothetical protein P8Y05_11435 [Deinococcales bacterium]